LIDLEYQEGENKGFAGGHEELWQRHNADLVLLVNHDVFLMPEYIATVRSFMEAHNEVGAAAGKILRWKLSDNNTPVFTNIIDSLGLAKTFYEKVYDIGSSHPLSSFLLPPSSPFGISGCLPMYRRQAIGKHLFDPTYFMYKEDVDVAYRLQKTGWTSTLVPQAVAYHLRGLPATALHQGIAPWAQFQSYLNHIRNLKKHLTWKDWLARGWFILPYEILKTGFLFITHPIAFPAYVLRHRRCYGRLQ